LVALLCYTDQTPNIEPGRTWQAAEKLKAPSPGAWSGRTNYRVPAVANWLGRVPFFAILRFMRTPIIPILSLCLSLACPTLFAADPPSVAAAGSPPSEASVKQLLEVTHARQLVDTVMSQMDQMMKNIMQQVTQGQPVPPGVQRTFDQTHAEVVSAMKEQLAWEKLEPMYVRIYQKSFTQGELDGIIGFYKTQAGQAVINKMPVVMQNTMNEVQQMMAPMMQRVQRMQQEMVAQMQAEKAKKSG
jgi:hypothetical protein